LKQLVLTAGDDQVARFQPGRSGNPGGRRKHGEKISDHLKDLLSMDAARVREIAEYLGERKGLGKICAARLVAASMILGATNKSEFAREILDRTEGRVVENLQVEARRVEYIVMMPESSEARDLTDRKPDLFGRTIDPRGQLEEGSVARQESGLPATEGEDR
jgi:hypothetical protein